MDLNIIYKHIKGSGRSVTVKKNIIASFVIKGVSILISLMLVPVTIGYVSAELYGVWLALSSVINWIHFLDLGFSQGLKNKLTEAIANKDWKRGKSLVSTTYIMISLIFIPVGILLEFLMCSRCIYMYPDDSEYPYKCGSCISTRSVFFAICCYWSIYSTLGNNSYDKNNAPVIDRIGFCLFCSTSACFCCGIYCALF